MKNAPCRNYEGGVNGRIEERKPDTGEGRAEVWGRKVASEGQAIFFFFFLELEQITILGTAKRNQPTKDKGQETKNRTKTMRVGRGGQGCRLSQDGGVLRARGSSSRSRADLRRQLAERQSYASVLRGPEGLAVQGEHLEHLTGVGQW